VTDPKPMLEGAFDRSASGYAAVSYFPVFGRWLVEQAHVPVGGDVLDVACGRGAVLIPAAVAVGPTGRAIGIDLSGEMARETADDLRGLGLTQATALQMDAERLHFPDDRFDRVLCGFAVHFFVDLDSTLAEFLRVLRPGGTVVATIWGEVVEAVGFAEGLHAGEVPARRRR
jgi:ubiquinone/menaquinone biosynthesis C-methylase UbiE